MLKSEAKKSHIAETAGKLLLEEGVDRLTHRRVAAAAEVPLGSTTQYFNGIDDLKRAGYTWIAKMVSDDYEAMLRVIEEAEGDTEAIVDELYPTLLNPDNIRADIALYHAALYDKEIHLIVAEQEKAFEKGLRAYLTDIQASAVSALITGLTVQQSLLDAPIDKQVIVDAFKALRNQCLGY